MPRPRKNLENRFRIARNNAGISLQDVADILDVTPAQIYNYERGTRFPTRDALVKLADLYKVSLDWLLGRDNPVLTNNVEKRSEFKGGVIDVKLLNFLGEIPVKYVNKSKRIDSFAILDQEKKCLRLPAGFKVSFKDVKKGEVYSFVDLGNPISLAELKKAKIVNVFSFEDTMALSGEYKVCGKKEKIVRNENDVTFHFSTYGLKWIAFKVE